jgi:hypothetical protein
MRGKTFSAAGIIVYKKVGGGSFLRNSLASKVISQKHKKALFQKHENDPFPVVVSKKF